MLERHQLKPLKSESETTEPTETGKMENQDRKKGALSVIEYRTRSFKVWMICRHNGRSYVIYTNSYK